MRTAVVAMALLALVIGVVLGLGSACTRVSVIRIADPSDSKTEGVRFYRPYPYLLISEVSETTPDKGTSDKKNPDEKKSDKAESQGIKPSKSVLQYKIIWLPDLSQEYAIQVRAGIGTVDFKPTFEEGWKLVGLDTKLDSKTKDMIEAVSGLLEKGAKLTTGAKAATKPLEPGIYRFVYDMRPKLPNGDPNLDYGKVVEVDFNNPVAVFAK